MPSRRRSKRRSRRRSFRAAEVKDMKEAKQTVSENSLKHRIQVLASEGKYATVTIPKDQLEIFLEDPTQLIPPDVDSVSQDFRQSYITLYQASFTNDLRLKFISEYLQSMKNLETSLRDQISDLRSEASDARLSNTNELKRLRELIQKMNTENATIQEALKVLADMEPKT